MPPDLTSFEGLSAKELRATARKLVEMAHRKEGSRDLSKERLRQLIDIKSDNYMGTGMSLHELLLCGKLEDFSRSFVTQGREERHRRLGFIIRLGAELDKVRQQGYRFATGMAESAIEDLIIGDWAMVQTLARHFQFTDESPDLRERYAPVFASFAGLLQEAFDTRPEAKSQPKPTCH